MGSQDSTSSMALLDAAERVICGEGYAAATTRRISAEAGVAQQLVYYYFETVDELLLKTLRRRIDQALDQLNRDATDPQPLQAIWANLAHSIASKLVFEFFALANRHEGIRPELHRFISQSRRIIGAAIDRHFQDRGLSVGPVSPAGLAVIIYCIALNLRCEAEVGVTDGHTEVRLLIDSVFEYGGRP